MKHFCMITVALGLFSLQDGIAAEPWKPVPRMTGQEFVERFFNSADTPLAQQSTKRLVERELALGYVAGVADASQGAKWCDKGLVKTIEIDAELAHLLRKLPPEALQSNAAVLIVELLRNRFPCN